MKWAVSLLPLVALCASQSSDEQCRCPVCNFKNVRKAKEHLFNVMLNKPAKISSNHQNAIGPCGAVNGNTKSLFLHRTVADTNCAHTGLHDKPYLNWIEYDLGKYYTIDRIQIIKRFDEGNTWHLVLRILNLEISLNGDICFSYPGFTDPEGFTVLKTHDLECYRPLTGQYLRFYKQNEFHEKLGYIYYIQLCEIIVWVCDAGYYGKPYEKCLPCPSQDKCLYETCDNYYGCDREVNVNLAPHLKATQSSILHGAPGNAVDNALVGDRETECTATDPEQDGPNNRWWRVDLGSLSRISHIKITNRMDCCGEALNNFKVLVSVTEVDISQKIPEDDICIQHNKPSQTGEILSFPCIKPLIGRYVAVVTESPNVLHFCEVQAYGYKFREIPLNGACDPKSVDTACIAKAKCASNKCKIIVGESCTEKDAVHCWEGTACSDKICALKLNQPCGDNRDHCRSDMSCDENAEFKCKIKMDLSCNVTADCITGTACDQLKQCKLPINANCENQKDKCPFRAVCDSGSGFTCRWDMGQTCDQTTSCITETICDVFKKCKRPIGKTCTLSDECTAGSSCISSKCFCAETSGGEAATCDPQEGRASGTCKAAAGTVCVQHSTCVNEICTCDTNYGVYTLNYTCRISVPGGSCKASYDCNIGLLCDGGACKFETGVACTETTECKGIDTCSEGICKIPVGKSCLEFPNLCVKGSICENGKCKLELRQVCEQNDDQCNQNTMCSKAKDETISTCKLKPGGSCVGVDKTLCSSMAVCDVDNVCKVNLAESCSEPYQTLCKPGTICSNQKCRWPLGRKCVETDHCVADAVCDKFLFGCKLQAGAKCTDPAMEGLCSSGSSCDTVAGTCTCAGDGSTTLVQNECVPNAKKVGGSCNPDDGITACDDLNAICITDPLKNTTKICECDAGFDKLLTNYTCGIGIGSFCGNTTVRCIPGASCSYDGLCELNVGQICKDDNARWCTTGSVCDDGICKANLRGDCSGVNKDNCKRGTICDVLFECKFPVNATCGTAEVCAAGSECTDSTCQCKSGLSIPNGFSCEPIEGIIKGKCKDSACTDPNAVCSAQGVCECMEGFTVQNADLSCKVGVDGPCTDSSSCTRGTTCDSTSGKCRLKLGQFCGGNQDHCTNGAVCDIDQKCKLDFNGNCKGHEMHCKYGYFCDADGKCKYGTSYPCVNETECIAGAICFNQTCRCIEAEAISTGTVCVPRSGFVGSYCDDVQPCTHGNATCVNYKCECVKSTRAKIGFQCNAPAKEDPKSAKEDFLWILMLVAGLLVLASIIGFLAFRRKQSRQVELEDEMETRKVEAQKLNLAMEKLAEEQKKKEEADALAAQTATEEESEEEEEPEDAAENEDERSRARRLEQPASKMGLIGALKGK